MATTGTFHYRDVQSKRYAIFSRDLVAIPIVCFR
jgi:hypothetical protein